jgi:DNA-binding CsgD family transcriptional regulator
MTSPGEVMASQTGVEGLSANTAEILTELVGIAAAPGTLAERAEALLAQLQRVVRFDAGVITLLPADQEALVPLAGSGYDERVRRHFESPAFLADAELVGLRRSRRALRPRDSPVPPSEVPSWAEYLHPAGFRDAVGAGLFTSEGRYLGLLAMHIRSADQVSEAARDLVGLLAAPIAVAVDPLRSLATIAGLVERAAAGIVLAPSGAVSPLPGLPDHGLLVPGSGVLTAATAQLAQGSPHTSFLAPLPAADAGEGNGAEGAATHARITVLAAPRDLRSSAAGIVVVSPAGDLHGLSRRELQVLGWLVTGAPDERIAQALGITARTVELHVDHVRAKLAAPTRTAAAARALRLGLFVPSSLHVRA